MDNIRFAVSDTTTVSPHGVPVEIKEGRAYAADDPVVVALPQLFSDYPTVYDHQNRVVTPTGYIIEQATQAPGEKRRRG